MMEAVSSSEMSISTRLQDITSQKTAFFMLVAVRTSKLTFLLLLLSTLVVQFSWNCL
jgi:hypothetical protein